MPYITGQEWSAYDLSGEGLYITSRYYSGTLYCYPFVLIYILFFNWLLFLLLGIKLGHQEEDGHTQIMGKKVKTAESYLFNSNTPHCKQLQWDACTLKYYFL